MTEGLEHYGHTERASGSHRYLGPKLVQLCRQYGATSVLDVGCGNGALCRDLHALGIHVVGLEPSRDGFETAKKLNPDIRFYRAGVNDSPTEIEENDFDLVVCAEVVEHLYAPELLPKMALEKLRPGGILLVTTPYHGYVKNLALAVLGKWDSHHQPLRTGGHIKFWSRASLQSLLHRNGFRVEKYIGVARIPYLWKSMILVAREIQRRD